jgi:hypothetical protein
MTIKTQIKQAYLNSKLITGDDATIDTFIALSSPLDSDVQTLLTYLTNARDVTYVNHVAKFTAYHDVIDVIASYNSATTASLSNYAYATDLSATSASLSNYAQASKINEVLGDIGTLSNLTTTAKGSAVAAINEVLGDVGTLSSLTTTAKGSAVAAINEVLGDIGTLSSLTTTAKGSAVAAINEVLGDINLINAAGWVNAGKIAPAAVTSAKQGFGTWKVTDGDDSWTGNTYTLATAISGCSVTGNIGDATTYYSIATSTPANEAHVEFADYLAISTQCAIHCSSQSGLTGCFNHFFNFL